MAEQVMVVDSALLLQTVGADSTYLMGKDEAAFLHLVQNNCLYLGRDVVETDPGYKQIIAYCIITHGDNVFMTRRTKKQTEARLHDRLSIGIGGHVAYQDSDTEDVVLTGLRRELHEEVCIEKPYRATYLGVINDNSTEVGKVHCGVCYRMQVAEGDCRVLETDKMVGQWVPFADMDIYYDHLEEWSQIVVNTLRRDGFNR